MLLSQQDQLMQRSASSKATDDLLQELDLGTTDDEKLASVSPFQVTQKTSEPRKKTSVLEQTLHSKKSSTLSQRQKRGKWINYKTLAKVPLSQLGEAQLELVNKAICSIDAHKPQGKKPVPILTQKQLVNSLERTLYPDGNFEFKYQDECLYRVLLKLHKHFLKRNEGKKSAHLEKQLQQLLNMYKVDVVKLRQSQIKALTYMRRQKLDIAFSALMIHQKRSSVGLGLKLNPTFSNSHEKDLSQINLKSILKSPQHSYSRSQPRGTRSSDNQVVISNQKPDSPIRTFLNQGQESARFQEFNQDLPHVVMQTGMFDMGSQSYTASQMGPSAHQTKQVLSQTALSELQSMTSPLHGVIATILPHEALKSFKLLKVFRHWRLYARQQVFKRKQKQIMSLSHASEIREAFNEEADLLSDLVPEDGLLDKVAIATNHYQDYLQLKAFKHLRAISMAQSELREEIESQVFKRYQFQRLRAMFEEWAGITTDRKYERRQLVSFLRKQWARKLKAIFKVFKGISDQKETKIEEFKHQRDQVTKARIYAVLQFNRENGVRNNDLARGFTEIHINRKLRRNYFQKLVENFLESVSPRTRQYEASVVFNFRMKKCGKMIKKWSEITEKNRKKRKPQTILMANHRFFIKLQAMNAWKSQWKEIHLGRLMHKSLLAKKVIRVLWKGAVEEQKTKVLVQACQVELNKGILARSFRRWIRKRIFLRENKLHEDTIAVKMIQCRKRQVLKAWYNLIDVYKKWEFINKNTTAWYCMRKLKVTFRAWRKDVQLKVKYYQMKDKRTMRAATNAFRALKAERQTRIDCEQFRKRVIKSGKRRALMSWYLLLSNKLREHFRFARRRKFTVLSYSFDALQMHLKMRKVYKKNLSKLLQSRAKMLLSKAFKHGLKKNWRVNVIHKKLSLAGVIHCKLRQMRVAYEALKQRWTVNRKLPGQIKDRAEVKLTQDHFGEWLKLFRYEDSGRQIYRLKLDKAVKSFFRYIQDQYLQSKTFKTTSVRQASKNRAAQRRRALSLIFNTLKKQAQVQKGRKALEKKVHYNFVMRHFGPLNMYAKKKIAKRNKWDNAIKYHRNVILNAFLGQLYSSQQQFKHIQVFKANLITRNKNKVFQVFAWLRSLKVKSKQLREVKLEGIRQRAFDKLFAYKTRRICIKLMKDKALEFRAFSVKNWVFAHIKKRIELRKIARKVAKVRGKFKCIAYLKEWHRTYTDVLEEGPARHVAIKFFAKRMIKRLRIACKTDVVGRRSRARLRQATHQFWTKMSKIRAVRTLKRNADQLRFGHMLDEFHRRTMSKKVMVAWFEQANRLRRKKVLFESADILFANSMFEKGFQALRDNADTRIKNRLIISRFRERADLVVKAEILTAIHLNIETQREKRQQFYDKTVMLAVSRLQEPFEQWIKVVVDQRMNGKADEFLFKRRAKYYKRRVFDCLRVYSARKTTFKVQTTQVEAYYRQMLQQKGLLGLSLLAKRNIRLREIAYTIRNNSKRRTINYLMSSMLELSRGLRDRQHVFKKAKDFYFRNLLKKSLTSLASQLSQHETEKVVCHQVQRRFVRDTLNQWKHAYKVSRRLKGFARVLQAEHDSRLLHKVFPRVLHHSYIIQVLQHMHERRENSYQQEFINQIRKQILLKKLADSFKRKQELKLKRSILTELRLFAFTADQHRAFVDDQDDMLHLQNQLDLMQTAFNTLRERMILKKFKQVAINCFALKTKKKCFMALQQKYYKKIILHKKCYELSVIQKVKYLWHWRQVYLRGKEVETTQKYLKSHTLYQVVTAWRKYTQKMNRARSFYRNVVQRNLKANVVHHLAVQINIQQRDQQLINYLATCNEQAIQKKVLMGWIEAYHDSKLNRKMDNYFAIKIWAKMLPQWREVVKKKNQQRMKVFFIKQQLNMRPELARPLRALKNFTMFKAFNKLVTHSSVVYTEDQKNDQARFANYLKITKKAFLSLKLGAQLGVQENQANEMADMFMKRRFFETLMKGVMVIKHEKREKQKAQIFRFLSLQRKAFLTLQAHSKTHMEQTIKYKSAQLLFKRHTQSKCFSILKAYHIQKQKRRAIKRTQDLLHEGMGDTAMRTTYDENVSPDMRVQGSSISPDMRQFINNGGSTSPDMRQFINNPLEQSEATNVFGYSNSPLLNPPAVHEQSYNIFNSTALAGAATSAEVTIQQTHPSVEGATLSNRTNSRLQGVMSKPEIHQFSNDALENDMLVQQSDEFQKRVSLQSIHAVQRRLGSADSSQIASVQLRFQSQKDLRNEEPNEHNEVNRQARAAFNDSDDVMTLAAIGGNREKTLASQQMSQELRGSLENSADRQAVMVDSMVLQDSINRSRQFASANSHLISGDSLKRDEVTLGGRND